MNKMIQKPVGFARAAASAAALVLMIGLGAPAARADEAAAKGMLKAMSDYLAAQKTILKFTGNWVPGWLLRADLISSIEVLAQL
jgi:hypothetical protein